MIIQKIAGGCNLPGYYVFHGGTNPIGKHAYMNECTVPKMSYDFQAPIGEFGQIRDSYRLIKHIHLFLHEFGESLCSMATVLPETAKEITPDNTQILRYSARTNNSSGYVFLINYQDHIEMSDKEDLQLRLELAGEDIIIPQQGSFTLTKDSCAIFPFNLNLDGIKLRYSTAQLITRLEESDGTYYFFFAHDELKPEYSFDRTAINSIEVEDCRIDTQDGKICVSAEAGLNCKIIITKTDNKKIVIHTLTREQAVNFWRVEAWGRERIIISEATIIAWDGFIEAISVNKSEMNLWVFPSPENDLKVSQANIIRKTEGSFSSFKINIKPKEIKLNIRHINSSKAELRISPDLFEGINDIYLRINYIGDVGNFFVENVLASDNFFNGEPWEIGLKRYVPEIFNKAMHLHVSPIERNRMLAMGMPECSLNATEGDRAAVISSIEAIPEYRVIISLN